MADSVKTISFRLVISWIFSVLFLLGAIGSLTNPVQAILYAIVGLLLLPPLSRAMEKKYHLKLSGGLKTFLAIGVIILVFVLDLSNAVQQKTTSAAADSTPQLKLAGDTGERSYGYITISGQVENISGSPMNDVEAVASFYDKSGTFITSSDAVIDYNPILAGQTSPFKVMQTDNPAIQKWTISFKSLFGGTIPSE